MFSHNTRFFIIVEDKNKLLKPIISRFCDIFIPLPIVKGEEKNLYQYSIENNFKTKQYTNYRKKYLDNFFSKKKNVKTTKDLFEISEKLYEKGYSGLDIINYIEDTYPSDVKKYQTLLFLNKIKKEFRDEKLFMIVILDLLFLRKNFDLENVIFM